MKYLYQLDTKDERERDVVPLSLESEGMIMDEDEKKGK
jgi:hypothetical protein